jgi:type IV pilus assembly protein PilA
MDMQNRRQPALGFTFIEVAVIVAIIGGLIVFGIPKFKEVLERSHAVDAFNYLSVVRAAEERYHSRYGAYTDLFSDLDITRNLPRHFTISTMTATNEQWILTLSRHPAHAVYGAYTVTFTHTGYDIRRSSINAHPAINPMGD